MVIEYWKAFGASVRGPGHARKSIANQDAFRAVHHFWGDVVVVSDGVGSLPTSDYGSATACRAVIESAKMWNEMNSDTNTLIEQIHTKWLSLVKPFDPNSCSATCLFAIRPVKGPIVLGMLGDGLIGVLKNNDEFIEFNEDKNEGFSNQTNALTKTTPANLWQTAFIPQEDCSAIVLCTDGVADDLIPEKREGFVRHIYHQGGKNNIIKATRDLRKMLENWPVPKHSDDKTLVCYYRHQEGLWQ